MSSVVKEVTINDLPSQVLTRIVCRGGTEDIVSKERISQRFGSAVDDVLASKKSMSVPDMKPVIGLTKRMPQLREFKSEELLVRMPRLRKSTSDELLTENAEELARYNPEITKFVSSLTHGRRLEKFVACIH